MKAVSLLAILLSGGLALAQGLLETERPFASIESGRFGPVPFFSVGSRDGYRISTFQKKLTSFLEGKGLRKCAPPGGGGEDGAWYTGSYQGSPEFYLYLMERQQILTFVDGHITWKEPDKAGNQETLVQALASDLRKLFEEIPE